MPAHQNEFESHLFFPYKQQLQDPTFCGLVASAEFNILDIITRLYTLEDKRCKYVRWSSNGQFLMKNRGEGLTYRI